MSSERSLVRPVRVSRRDLAESPIIWLLHGITLIGVAIAVLVLGLRTPEYEPVPTFALAASLGLCAIWVLGTKPPALGTLPSHLSLTSAYLLVGFAELALAPDWMVPLAAAGFVGTLIATRIESARWIVAHLVAATICVVGPAALLGASAAQWVGVTAVASGIWALCGCCVALLVAAERQGQELEARVRMDPLTGTGNQRLLNETLEVELEAHAQLRRPLAVLALDLADFTELNEQLGRTAGDAVLASVARAIQAGLGPEAVVSRPIDDEFWVLLPATDALAAQSAIEQVRQAIAAVPAPSSSKALGLVAAFGIATYPRDGVLSDRLMDLAHERMAGDRQLLPPIHESRALPIVAATTVPWDRPPVRGVSRSVIARSRPLWGFAAALALLGGVLAVVSTALVPGADLTGAALVAGLFVVSAIVGVVPRPPGLHDLRNHVVIVLHAICTGAAFVALPADTGVAVAMSAFIAPVIAVRTESRRTAILHLAFAGMVLSSLALVGLLTGSLERVALLQLGMIVASTWSLGVSCTIALEIVDAQGRELETMIRTDQITGLGNRLDMQERLQREIARHRQLGAPLSVLVLELVETFENSRGATEQLLRGAAEALAQAVGPQDTVIRRRGHEFVLILPNAGPPEIDHAASAVFASLAALDSAGHRVECVHAAATFPDDGDSAAAVLAVADARLMHAGAPVGFRRPLGSS